MQQAPGSHARTGAHRRRDLVLAVRAAAETRRVAEEGRLLLDNDVGSPRLTLHEVLRRDNSPCMGRLSSTADLLHPRRARRSLASIPQARTFCLVLRRSVSSGRALRVLRSIAERRALLEGRSIADGGRSLVMCLWRVPGCGGVARIRRRHVCYGRPRPFSILGARGRRVSERV